MMALQLSLLALYLSLMVGVSFKIQLSPTGHMAGRGIRLETWRIDLKQPSWAPVPKSYFRGFLSLPCNYRKPWFDYPCQTSVNLWKRFSSSFLLTPKMRQKGRRGGSFHRAMSKGSKDVEQLEGWVPAPWVKRFLPYLPAMNSLLPVCVWKNTTTPKNRKGKV